MQAAFNSSLTTMFALVKREYREQRLLFLLLPVGLVVMIQLFWIANLVKLGFRLSYIASLSRGERIEGSRMLEEAVLFEENPFVKEMALRAIFDSHLFMLELTFWLTLPFYFLITLYNQRQNRSILFWSSMPVSNTQTVTSKLLAGYVVAGGVYVVAVLATLLLFMLSLSVFGLLNGVDVTPFYTHAHLLTRFTNFLVLTLFTMLWCLPVHAALLLASGWAKRAPFAWVMAGPVIAILIEATFNLAGNGRMDSQVMKIIVDHAWPRIASPLTGVQGVGVATIWNQELLWSVLLGCLFIGLAMRFNRVDE